MKLLIKICCAAGLAVAALVGTVLPVVAEPMPALAPEERRIWQAVGRVNSAGYRVRRGCTGTLIASDLVLTAAHCVKGALSKSERHFVAGWDRGSFVAHRTSKNIEVHPLYADTDGTERLRYDVALIRLADPIPASVVAPLELYTGTKDQRARAGTLLGYHNRRPHVLNAHKGCPHLSSEPFWLFGCEVISGNSGGPTVIHQDNRALVAGVISARAADGAQTIVAPIDLWVRRHWREAQDRARMRN